MAEIEHNNNDRKPKPQRKLIIRCLVSFLSVLLIQFALFLVPQFSPSSSLLTLLSLSVVVVLAVAGLGRVCKNLLGVRASAPSFVFINIFYVWCVYLIVIRPAISSVLDIVFNIELAILLIGLCSILSSDPGYVASGSSYPGKLVASPLLHVEAHLEDLEPSSCDEQDRFLAVEESTLVRRVRFCKVCKVHVKGFDHHCPAFGNCIGHKNHVLFIILLVGFIVSEASYIGCSSQFVTKSHVLDKYGRKVIVLQGEPLGILVIRIYNYLTTLSSNLANSTMLFSLLQVLWQVVFLTWHIYCVCFNITTDEWINWKKYPELQMVVQHQPGKLLIWLYRLSHPLYCKVTFKYFYSSWQPPTGTRFINPYDKGILQNLKDFLKAEG